MKSCSRFNLVVADAGFIDSETKPEPMTNSAERVLERYAAK
jgi:hypothetical protein